MSPLLAQLVVLGHCFSLWGVSRGARDSVSAVYRFLPGTCTIVYVKRINRSRNLRTRDG